MKKKTEVLPSDEQFVKEFEKALDEDRKDYAKKLPDIDAEVVRPINGRVPSDEDLKIIERHLQAFKDSRDPKINTKMIPASGDRRSRDPEVVSGGEPQFKSDEDFLKQYNDKYQKEYQKYLKNKPIEAEVVKVNNEKKLSKAPTRASRSNRTLDLIRGSDKSLSPKELSEVEKHIQEFSKYSDEGLRNLQKNKKKDYFNTLERGMLSNEVDDMATMGSDTQGIIYKANPNYDRVKAEEAANIHRLERLAAETELDKRGYKELLGTRSKESGTRNPSKLYNPETGKILKAQGGLDEFDKKRLEYISKRAKHMTPEMEKRIMAGEPFEDILRDEIDRMYGVSKKSIGDTTPRDFLSSALGQHLKQNYDDMSADDYINLQKKFYPESKAKISNMNPEEMEKAYGTYDPKNSEIKVHPELPENIRLATAAHELGHDLDSSGKIVTPSKEIITDVSPHLKEYAKEFKGHHKGRIYEYDNLKNLVKGGKLRAILPVGAAIGAGAMSDSAQASEDSSDAIDTTSDALRGAVQGTTLGFSDEALGGLQALKARYIDDSEEPLAELYRKFQQEEEQKNLAAEERSPYAYNLGDYGAGILTGGVALKGLSKAPKIASAISRIPELAKVMGLGGIAGAGYAPGEGDIQDKLINTGVGMAAGPVLSGTVKGVIKGSKASKKGFDKLRKALSAE